MRLKSISCMWGVSIVLMVVCLFLVVGDIWAQCISGQRDSFNPVPSDIELPYVGLHVPSSILAEGFSGLPGYYTSSNGPSYSCGYSIPGAAPCSGYVCPSVIWSQSTSGYGDWNYSICWCDQYAITNCVVYNYMPTTGDPNVLDYDCDGRFDSHDPNPGMSDASEPANNGNPGCISTGK